MFRRRIAGALALLTLGAGLASATEPGPEVPATDLAITPAPIALDGPGDRQRVVVTGTVGGTTVDLSRAASFRTDDPEVVSVTADGLIRPVGDGEGVVIATVDGVEATATVRVTGARHDPSGDVRARRDAAADAARLQRGRLPRQAAGAERVPALAARLRPGLGPGRVDDGGAGPPRLPGGSRVEPDPPQGHRRPAPRRRQAAGGRQRALRGHPPLDRRPGCTATPTAPPGSSASRSGRPNGAWRPRTGSN